MAKNGHVHEGGNIRRNNATPTKLFSVDFDDLKFMSFEFGYDIIFGHLGRSKFHCYSVHLLQSSSPCLKICFVVIY